MENVKKQVLDNKTKTDLKKTESKKVYLNEVEIHSINKIKDKTKNVDNLKFQLGHLSFEIEKIKLALYNSDNELQTLNSEFNSEMKNKYGNVNINLETFEVTQSSYGNSTLDKS